MPKTKPETKRFTLDLTKDEVAVLRYVIPRDSYGDPLKDIYELGDDEPDDPYKALGALNKKLKDVTWKRSAT